MNASERARQDELTRLPKEPTLCEMVNEKDDSLERISDRIPSALFNDRFAGNAERNPNCRKISSAPLCTRRAEDNASISEIVGNKQRARSLKRLLGPT